MGSSRRAVAILGVAGGAAIGYWLGSVLVAGLGIEVVPVVGVAFVASLALGDWGAFGTAAGVLVGGILAGAFGAVTVTTAAAVLVYGLAVPRAWAGVSATRGDGQADRSWEALPAGPVVAVVAAALGAGAAGSAASLLTGVSFFVAAADTLVHYAVGGLVLGWPAAVGLSRLSVDLGGGDGDPRSASGWSTVARFGSIAAVWLATGVGVDLGLTVAKLVPASFYRSRVGLAVSPSVFDAVQLAGQVAVLLVVFAILRRWGLLGRPATGAGDVTGGEPSRQDTIDSSRQDTTASSRQGATESSRGLRLTRRHALVVLAGMGVAAVGTDDRVERGSRSLTGDERQRLLAVTDVLYPSEVSVDDAFVRTYVAGRYRTSHEDRRHVSEALAFLDEVARNRFGEPFASLPEDNRERVLEAIGVDRVSATADGRLPERVRYYLVNDLLFALYATPVGGELVGRDNPTGFPGGLEAYQRGPER